MNKYEQKVYKANYETMVRITENILLRPNDNKLLMGDESFNQLKAALEKKLEDDYKNEELYKYYHGLNKAPHGFCDFTRWKAGLLFL